MPQYVTPYVDLNGIQYIDGSNGMHVGYDSRSGILTHDNGQAMFIGGIWVKLK